MKKGISIIVVIVTILVALLYFQFNYTKKTNELGNANQIEGLTVFTDNNPILEYEFLGTVKVDTSKLQDAEYDHIRDQLIIKAKTQFANAQGIIITPKDKKAVVVKFHNIVDGISSPSGFSLEA